MGQTQKHPEKITYIPAYEDYSFYFYFHGYPKHNNYPIKVYLSANENPFSKSLYYCQQFSETTECRQLCWCIFFMKPHWKTMYKSVLSFPCQHYLNMQCCIWQAKHANACLLFVISGSPHSSCPKVRSFKKKCLTCTVRKRSTQTFLCHSKLMFVKLCVVRPSFSQ